MKSNKLKYSFIIIFLILFSCDDSGTDTSGCMDDAACNFDAESTIDDGSCLEFDCLGDCGGSADVDECGICDGPGSISGCACEDIPDGDCDCEGNQLDCTNECGGSAILDDCAVCDGGNADMDECGVCNGDGPAAGFDCDGNALVVAYSEIQSIFSSSCSSCHINNSFGGVSLASYDILIASNLVDPGNHENSLLWQVVNNNSMPDGWSSSCLSDFSKDLIATWIDQGANNP